MIPFKGNMNGAMLLAIPDIRHFKTEVLRWVDLWVEAKALSDTKLPAKTERGDPILVGALNHMGDICELYASHVRANMRYLRLALNDVEYYKFETSLKIRPKDFLIR